MKLRCVLAINFLCFISCSGMSPSVVADSQQGIKDCEKRLEDLKTEADDLIDYNIVCVTAAEQKKRADSQKKFEKSAQFLLTDIEGLIQRFPSEGKSLNQTLKDIYVYSYNLKGKPVFGEYGKEANPEMRFYNWISDLESKNFKDHEKVNHKNNSGSDLAGLMEKVTLHEGITDDYKMCFRELMTHFGSPYAQQNYDAYLVGSANELKISRQEYDTLLNMIHKIMEIKSNLALAQ